MINGDLNLVLPIRTNEKGEPLIYCYHTPISRAVFEANYRVLAATKSALASKGIHYQMDSGPGIATLTMMDEARKDALDSGNIDKDDKPIITGAIALLAELRRLSMVLIPTETGWVTRPVDIAIDTGQIDADEWREVESAIVFFTSLYSLAKRAKREAMHKATSSVLSGSSTSLPISEFASSLMQSMKAAHSEGTAA